MKQWQKDRIWLYVWILCYLLLSASIVLMAMDATRADPGVSVAVWLPGVLFWTSLLGGICAQIVLSCRRRRWYRQYTARRGRSSSGIGMFSFFKNRYAVVADIAMLVVLVGLIVTLWLTRGHGFVSYLSTALFVLLFSLHSILNGKVFYYVMHRENPSHINKKEHTKSIKREGKEDND